MNKKVIIILIILLLLYFVTKAQKPKSEETTGEIVIPNTTYYGTYSWKYYRVKSGDTFYKIAKANIPLEKAMSYAKDFPEYTENVAILDYAQALAQANGFDWALFDSKPTTDLKDPDTLKVGQKLILWSWESFRDFGDRETGFLLPFTAYTKFGTWEPLENAPQHMKDAFLKYPPASL